MSSRPETAPRAAGQSGISLVETMIAVAVSSILAVAFFGMFFGFGDDIVAQERRATTLEAARGVLARLVVDLRQAVDLDGDGAVVVTLDSRPGRLDLVFVSDGFADQPGPERYEYRLEACRGVRCDLVRSVTAADPGSGPNWTYTGAPVARVVLQNVRTDGPDPLFEGVSYRAGTGAPVVTRRCDATSPCAFDLLRIRLRVDSGTDGPAGSVVELREDVRFRNGGR